MSDAILETGPIADPGDSSDNLFDILVIGAGPTGLACAIDAQNAGFRVVLGKMPATAPLPVALSPLNQRNVRQEPAPLVGSDPKKPLFVDFAADKKNPTMPPGSFWAARKNAQ